MKAIKVLTLCLITISLFGCSTTPISQQTGKLVPQDRIYDASFVRAIETKAELAYVTFLRDRGYAGAGCSHEILVNSRKVFAIRDGEFLTLKLKPGDYLFNLNTGHGLCPNISISEEEKLKAGDQIEYRILLPSDGVLRLSRIK